MQRPHCNACDVLCLCTVVIALPRLPRRLLAKKKVGIIRKKASWGDEFASGA